jgi:zinc protease
MSLAAFASMPSASWAAEKVGDIRLVQLPSPSSPLVTLRLVFQSGAADDEPGKEGLTALTAAMLGEASTVKRTWSEVLDALYPMAVEIDVHGDKDTFVFAGTVHRDNLEVFADLLAEQVLTPRFSSEDFTRLRQEALDAVTKTLRGNDDEALGKQALATLLYPGHPYAHPTLGTAAGLRALTLADVERCYTTRFSQDRLIVGVAGGYPEGFPLRFAARFSGLPQRGSPRSPLPPPTVTTGGRMLMVEKPALGNAISIGHPIDVTRADDDFYPLFLAASYLGEHRTFNGVLMREMRQRRGLNYGDYAYVENFIQDGASTFPLTNLVRRQQHFEIWLRPVAPASAGFAIRQAIRETARLIREGIPQAGFEATRQFLTNHVKLWAQDGSRRLGYAIDAQLYGKDVIAELTVRLPRMTKSDVDRALRRHLSTERLSVVVVGDQVRALADALAAGRATPIVYDTNATPADVLAEDELIEVYPLPISVTDIRIVSAKTMFEK